MKNRLCKKYYNGGEEMSKKRYYQKLYKFDNENNTYTIEVSLDDYNDIYDDWDPSPFKKRDIEDEFDDFIVNASEDIPLSHNISIVLYLPKTKQDSKKEDTLISAYRNFYNYTMERINKQLVNLNKKTISYLFLSMFLLSIGYFFFKDAQNIFINVLHEGILIGGWVFLWEFFTNIIYKGNELRNTYKLYKRLFNAHIKFSYLE